MKQLEQKHNSGVTCNIVSLQNAGKWLCIKFLADLQKFVDTDPVVSTDSFFIRVQNGMSVTCYYEVGACLRQRLFAATLFFSFFCFFVCYP